jgi:hypothetical protein
MCASPFSLERMTRHEPVISLDGCSLCPRRNQREKLFSRTGFEFHPVFFEIMAEMIDL